VHQARDDPRIGLILVGFSPPQRLAALARHLGWPGRVLADQQRALYRRLGVGRAPLWRVYSPATLATYAAAAARGYRLARPVEDTRQLGRRRHHGRRHHPAAVAAAHPHRPPARRAGDRRRPGLAGLIGCCPAALRSLIVARMDW